MVNSNLNNIIDLFKTYSFTVNTGYLVKRNNGRRNKFSCYLNFGIRKDDGFGTSYIEIGALGHAEKPPCILLTTCLIVSADDNQILGHGECKINTDGKIYVRSKISGTYLECYISVSWSI